MTAWVFAVAGSGLLWAMVANLMCPRRAWQVGVPGWKKRFLVVGSVFICALMTVSGAAMWIVHGSFHPVFFIIMALGLPVIDVIVAVRKLPVRPAPTQTQA